MSIKALLFDLDGTLVDTAADFVLVLNEQRLHHGLEKLCENTIRNTVSNGARALTQLAFGGNQGESVFEARRQELLDRYELAAGNSAHLFEGMEQVLHECKQQGIPWGIITNKPRLYTDILLKKIFINNESLFHASAVTLCPDDVTNSKPDPESLFLAADKLKVAPKDCVYVGDHIRDIQAGLSAGMTTVAATYGYINDQNEISEWNSDHYINKPIDLLSLFRK